jgi:hypothetical protein
MRLAVVLVLAIPLSAAAQVREAARLQFVSAFWPNLHHTLYAASLPADRQMPSAPASDLTAGMTDAERATWRRAVEYYAREMSAKDLRAGEGMAEINETLSRAADAPSGLAPEHADVLRAAAPVYRRLLWPAHDRANQAWIRDVAARLEQIAPVVVPRLARVYDTPWFATPHRIDVTFFGRAYTYGRPVWHTFMASGDPLYARWAGAEMSLHEASHALLDRLSAEIDRQAASLPRDTRDWHLAMFYMVGEITREAVAARGEPYTPYLYVSGAIDRGWPGQRPALENRLKRYVDDEKMSMADGIRAWLAPGPFRFRVGFWNNLHSFLYVLGRDRNGAPDRTREAVVNAPKDVEGLSARSEAERAAWESAIAFYAAGPSKKDAVFDADLVRVTRTLAGVAGTSDVSTLGLDPGLVEALRTAAPIYRAVWWPRHLRAGNQRLEDLQTSLEKYGDPLVKRLTAVYGTAWPSAPRTVDIAAYTNWAGAYSTDGGLIEFASTYPGIAGIYGLETLLHEASHQWDEEIDRRLSAIADRAGRPLPGLLSHALIFYTSGAIVSEVVPGHVPYATKFGVWDRGMSALKPLLEMYWRPHIQGSVAFEDAIAAILRESRLGS